LAAELGKTLQPAKAIVAAGDPLSKRNGRNGRREQ
jgi:hypothetical protein